MMTIGTANAPVQQNRSARAKTAGPQLVRSTSGIRGVIGNGMDPALAIDYAMAFGTLLRKGTFVVGRDSRPSGEMLTRAVVAGLTAVGIDVVEIGIVPTPTVEIAVKKLKSAGGICVTASHNPSEWNALKFFNNHGEFITPAQYQQLNAIYEARNFARKPFSKLGTVEHQDKWIDAHITMTLKVPTVKRAAIKKRRFTVVVDAINGAGSLALPDLLEKLGVRVIRLNCNGDGNFVHKPEPTPAHLTQLARTVKQRKADLGLACDPDADRLALVDETGTPISEELTLAIAVRQVLKSTKGPTVINLSTSSITAAIARSLGSTVQYSKVGESNVVQTMRQVKAVIGGEGNGGVIYPAFHAGRDSLIAAALVLSCLAEERTSLAKLVETFPRFHIIKLKAPLPDDFHERLERFESEVTTMLGQYKLDRRDGLRFDFDGGWLQIRSSNTEPIFRLIVETTDRARSAALGRRVTRYFTE